MLRDPHAGHRLGKDLLSLRSELPKSPCSAALPPTSTTHPAHSNVMSTLASLGSLSDVTRCNTLLLQHELAPGEGAPLQRVIAATLPSKPGRISPKGAPPGWRNLPGRSPPAADAVCAAGSLWSILFILLRWHCCRPAPRHGTLHQAFSWVVLDALQCLEPWTVSDLSPYLPFTLHPVELDLLGEWFPP